jgi:hypothetical protein
MQTTNGQFLTETIKARISRFKSLNHYRGVTTLNQLEEVTIAI